MQRPAQDDRQLVPLGRHPVASRARLAEAVPAGDRARAPHRARPHPRHVRRPHRARGGAAVARAAAVPRARRRGVAEQLVSRARCVRRHLSPPPRRRQPELRADVFLFPLEQPRSRFSRPRRPSSASTARSSSSSSSSSTCTSRSSARAASTRSTRAPTCARRPSSSLAAASRRRSGSSTSRSASCASWSTRSTRASTLPLFLLSSLSSTS